MFARDETWCWREGKGFGKNLLKKMSGVGAVDAKMRYLEPA